MFAAVADNLKTRAAELGVAPPRLLAVSKQVPADTIQRAYAEGAREFGENYVPEAVAKIPRLADDCVWHLIGSLQSNKTAMVANHFHWVQSLDRAKIARRLASQRPHTMPPLQVCIQINIDGEASKSGCTPDAYLELADQVVSLPQLQLRGIMVIPAPGNADTLRNSFLCAAQLFRQMQQQYRNDRIDTLSMGMSGDWQLALELGSNMVRIGTAIFGARGQEYA